MATFLSQWYARIKGGWKTVSGGPPGFMAAGEDWTPDQVGPYNAMKLSAYFACQRLLSETMGAMEFELFDSDNNLIQQHDLYGLMDQPNPYQTGDAFIGAMATNKNTFGNSMALINRLAGKPYSLDFYATDMWAVTADNQGRPATFSINGEVVPYDNVLHWPGMSLNGYWGLPPLVAAGEVLATQTQSNRSAAQVFKSGLRAGGFFEMPDNKQAFDDPQLEKFNENLKAAARPENTARWMPLLPGMKAVANQSFRIDPVTAELLQSRYFGIEEICRFLGVPPPLIGHTDKASSWASSLDGLNQFLVTYTLLPQAVRLEREIRRKLLGRNHGIQLRPRFNMDSLLRGDIKTRYATYETGIGVGMLSPNDARSAENLPPRAGGNAYVAPSAKPVFPPAAPQPSKQEK